MEHSDNPGKDLPGVPDLASGNKQLLHRALWHEVPVQHDLAAAVRHHPGEADVHVCTSRHGLHATVLRHPAVPDGSCIPLPRTLHVCVSTHLLLDLSVQPSLPNAAGQHHGLVPSAVVLPAVRFPRHHSSARRRPEARCLRHIRGTRVLLAHRAVPSAGRQAQFAAYAAVVEGAGVKHGHWATAAARRCHTGGLLRIPGDWQAAGCGCTPGLTAVRV